MINMFQDIAVFIVIQCHYIILAQWSHFGDNSDFYKRTLLGSLKCAFDLEILWKIYAGAVQVVSWPKPFHPDQTFTSWPPGQPDNELADTSVNKVDETILTKKKEYLKPRKQYMYI